MLTVHKAPVFNHCAIPSNKSYFSLSSKLTNWLALAKKFNPAEIHFPFGKWENNASVVRIAQMDMGENNTIET